VTRQAAFANNWAMGSTCLRSRYIRAGALEEDLTLAPFAGLEELFGFISNLFRAQILLPRVIEAEAGIARAVVLEERALARKQKPFILLAVAAAYQNTYCIAAWHRMLQVWGLAERQLDHIIIDHHQADLSAADAALLDFALKLATDAPWVSGRDVAALSQCGFADEAILEAILVTALSNLLCTLSIGLSPTPDFEPRAIPSRRNTSPSDKRASYNGGISGPYLRRVELTPDSFPPFAFLLERFGFIPDLFRAQTLRPDVIEAEAGMIRNVLVPDDILSRRQKECILLVGSAANLNTYCVAAHCEMLRGMGVSLEESDQIAIDHHHADLSRANKALLDFALKLTVRPLEFHSNDTDNLRRHGFFEKQILEAIVTTGINNFLNTLQMGLGTTPDVEPVRVFGLKEAHLPVDREGLAEGAPVDPDAELVVRVQKGDLNAFEELAISHSRRVYRTLISIIGNVQEAQDAMQDSFLKAFEHIGDFQGRSKFSTWLTSIASNTALQRLRERRRLEGLDDAGDEAECRLRQVRAWDADPEQLYSQAERRRLVESALMKIPSKYRVVLVLRDLEQLSTEEAAAALGLAIPGLKARLFRARMMLREALSPHFAMRDQRTNL
jgi:RNA polymerase sigma-70 factor, ECF subfamily